MSDHLAIARSGSAGSTLKNGSQTDCALTRQSEESVESPAALSWKCRFLLILCVFARAFSRELQGIKRRYLKDGAFFTPVAYLRPFRDPHRINPPNFPEPDVWGTSRLADRKVPMRSSARLGWPSITELTATRKKAKLPGLSHA